MDGLGRHNALSDEVIDRIVCRLEERLLARLRVELMALHLGDDATVTEEEAARLLETSTRTMRRLRDEDELPYGKLGKSPRYSLGVLRRFMRRLARETINP